MGYTILSVVALAASVLGVLALVWVASRGHAEREAEASAREHFDRHGRWPDE